MRLVIDEECSWIFEVLSPALSSAAVARRSSSGSSDAMNAGRTGGGEKFITLQSFFNDLSSLMHSRRVPMHFWKKATSAKRFRAARGMEKRTGRSMPSSAITLPGRDAGNAELDAYVRAGAPGPEWTGLKVSDLLGPEDVMFWGLVLSRAPDEWVLRTAPSRS